MASKTPSPKRLCHQSLLTSFIKIGEIQPIVAPTLQVEVEPDPLLHVQTTEHLYPKLTATDSYSEQPLDNLRSHVINTSIPDSITVSGCRTVDNRSFHASWTNDHPWLCYEPTRHVCWCEPCCWVHGENRFPKFVKAFDVNRSPLIVGRYVNWKRGREMVERYESSLAHREAEKLFLHTTIKKA